MNINTLAEAVAWLKTVRHFNCASVISIIDAALAREAALRESLTDKREEYNKLADRYDALQVRLTVAEQLVDELTSPPELTNDLRYIFGMMCFQCITYAQVLRGMGHTIANKAEDEQAATIHWMYGHYLRDPDNWRTNTIAEIKAAKLASEQQ